MAWLVSPTALQGWKLAWWATAFSVGAYAGYQIALYGDGDWGVVGLMIRGAFYVTTTFAVVAILGFVSTLVYRALSAGRLPGATTLVIAVAFYVAGVSVGFVMTPALGLEYRYREPVALEAGGTMTLSLNGLAGYSARSDVPAACWSELDGERLASVSATAIGAIDGVDVNSSVGGIDLEASFVSVSLPTVDSKFLTWSGAVDFIERTQDGRDARVTFVGAVLYDGGTGGPEQGNWPDSLSGAVSWRCGDWLGPLATGLPQASP